MNFVSGSGPLTSQVKQLLQDGPMFQFLCERSFQNHAVDGVVTLPAVAPMVEGVLKSLGRPVLPTEVYRVWNDHCDPDMHHMSLSHFEPFLRTLLEDYLRDAEVERTEPSRLAVTQPTLDGLGTGYPDMTTRTLRDMELPAGTLSAEHPKNETRNELPDPIAPAAPEPSIVPSPKQEPKPSEPAEPAQPASRRKNTPPPKAKADLKPKDSAAVKAKRPMTPKNGANSSASKPSPPSIQVQEKPQSFLTDALHEAHINLLPEILDLLPDQHEPGDPRQEKGAGGIFNSMREALTRLRALCEELGENYFVDPDFGPTPADSTGKKALLPGGTLPAEAFQNFPGHDQVLWHRPCEAWPEKHQFCGELANVRTGVFGDAWFIGALCSLSMNEEELFGHPSGYEEPLGVYPRVFWDSEFRRRGLYCFRFSKQGQWKYVVIDDRLPFHRKTSQPLFSHAVGIDGTPCIWVALMEKAFAKLHRAYFALWLGFVDDALEDLTSWPAEKIQISKFGKSDGKRTAKDPSALWLNLFHDSTACTSLICLRADAGSPGSDGSDLVHIDPRSIQLDAHPEVESFCTGIFRNWAYPIVSLCEVDMGTGDKIQFVRLRSFAGTWHGPWGDQDLNWSQVPPDLAQQLQGTSTHRAHFLVACSVGSQEDDAVHASMLRPIMPLDSKHSQSAISHDGTFFMRFEDWMQVYSHVLIRHQLNEGWNCIRLDGCWTPETCGGTPIPVMQPVLATLESWARNPQCILILEADFDVEVFVTLHQCDARLNGVSPFPFEDQLRQIFLCIMHLEDEERLMVFDKKRIVRHNGASAATPVSQRRSVLLRTRLKSPGSYAIVPSIWEPELPKGMRVPFVLSLHVQCDFDKFIFEAPEAEGWAKVGYIYEDAFRELYAEKPGAFPPDPVEEGAAEGEEAVPGPFVRDDGEIDLNKEADEIKAIQEQVLSEEERLQQIQQLLHNKIDAAREGDQQEAQELLERWGLVMREQLPVPQSKLKEMLDRDQMEREDLIVPRGMMEDMERYYEIKKGTIPHHDNLLAVSKPEEPNHFKMTRSQKLRADAMQVKPTLTEQQRTAIAGELEERLRKRPRMPAGLSADQKAKNREIVKRMQMKVNFLKNPRFLADRGGKDKGEPCPFWFTPDVVLFRNYEIGGLYQIQVEFRNCTGISRRLRVLPCKSGAFSIKELHYDKELNSQRPELVGLDPLAAVVAPGLAAHLVVQFAPSTLNDENDFITVCTEIGDFELPLLSRREQPSLKVADPVDCGCMLAGNQITEMVRIQNSGGEGAFRLIVNEENPPEDYFYETIPGSDLNLVVGSFSVSPASFYMDANSSMDLRVRFDADKVGHHSCPLFVEGDNGEKTPLNVIAVCDAIRLEMARWPTLQKSLTPMICEDGTSPWQLVPWRLDWLKPGTQVGHMAQQTIEIANGGFMPMRVDWALARPPRQFSARLAVGSLNRLSDRLINEIHDWSVHLPATHSSPSCPFRVEPSSITLKPFTRQKFTFSFHAHGPVGAQSSVFAYLVARDLPDSEACILHYKQLLELQSQMQPEDKSYPAALPLFGSIVSQPFDRKVKISGSTDPVELKVADPKDCSVSRVITAVSLQGRSCGPTIAVLPRVIALPGDVLPFVPTVREIKLHNSGHYASYFRVRLTSTMHAADANSIDPLWVVSVPEVGVKPQAAESNPRADPVLEEMRMQASRLAKSWPPLPPEPGIPGASQLPGYGALAACAVEPHEGRIPPGGVVTIRVTVRAVHECDLDAQLVIDLPLNAECAEPAAAPLKVGIAAAFRSPKPEIRSRAILDYGVVRAHSRHTLKVELSNPTEMPMLLQLRQFKDNARDHTFPVESHREVVNLFLEAVNQRSRDGFAAIASDQYVEVPVQPWVHSKSGCLDKSGRRKFGTNARSAEEMDDSVYIGGVPDEEDFVFHPGFLALWPGKSGEVEVTLRSRGVGKYHALLEAVGFNSLHAQCLEVFASVQLPLVRINTHHAHFPVTYLRTASEPMEVELRNESEMPADFNWKIPLNMEACLECQIQPSQGHIPPRGRQICTVIAVPSNLVEDGGRACLPCQLFVEEILQPLELRVTAMVYGCEVDYAVVEPGDLPPEIVLQPRQPGESACDPRGTYMISTGRAPRKMPIVDFGNLPLQRAKVTHVVLYNRTGIATPFSAKIEKNPAFDPLVKGRKIGDYLDAATRMYALINQSGGAEPDEDTLKQTFESSPQPAGGGREEDTKIKVKKLKSTLNKTKKTSTKKKKWILDDKHERQAFRSSIGADFAKQKEMKEQGRMALKAGRGFAVKVSPTSDWLQPFSASIVVVTSFSDLPGLMEDDALTKWELVLTLRELPGHSAGEVFRIPLRLQSMYGNPLYLPDQQVGLNTLAVPPRLSCGVTVPAEKQLVRRFKVGNNSAARVVVSWKAFPKSQLENMAEDRNMIHVALCGRTPEIKDPFIIEPKKEDPNKDVLQLKVEEEEKPPDDDEEPDPDEPFNFKIWSEPPPEIEDPFSLSGGRLPMIIEPEEAIVPEHGTATFTVTMTCMKATLTAANNYRYTLIGDCRFTADREERLAFAETNPDEDFDDVIPHEVYVAPSQDEQVKALPDIELDGENLVDDDSDLEQTSQEKKEQAIEVPAPIEASTKKTNVKRTTAAPPQPLAVESRVEKSRGKLIGKLEDGPMVKTAMSCTKEPQLDVLATIVIDCTGDCVLPRLTVDKKGNPDVEEFPAQNKEQDDIGSATEPPILNAPVFKFTWPTVDGSAPLSGTGAVQGGAVGGQQAPGITLCQVRQISFANDNASKVTCRFRTEGPFKIQLIQQPGHHPVQSSSSSKSRKDKGDKDDPIKGKLFALAKWETITLHVAFLPEHVPASEWHHYLTRHEHVFKGDLIVEYPRETSGESATHKDDLQRIHLVGTARRPAVRIHLVPNEFDRPLRLERAERPPWSEPMPLIVEFGYTHITSSVTRSRTILISNVTNIMAKWSLAHVGRKRRAAPIIGSTLPEEEEFRALDDKDAFEFEISGGELPGPSKDGLVPGSEERLPHWCAKSSAVPRIPPFEDDERFEPQRVKIAFRPKKNELYKCRFRVQVESGLSLDFICRGCGSYDEEDDSLDFHEA